MLYQWLNRCLNPYLLLIFSVILIAVSITNNSPAAETYAVFLVSAMMILLAVRIAHSGHRVFSGKVFAAVLLLIGISTLCHGLAYFSNWPSSLKALFFVSATLIRLSIFTMGWLLLVKTLAVKQKVTEHTIVTAIVGYLFIGIIWSFIYYIVWQVDPDGFHLSNNRDYDFKPWNLIMYYSFSTLTTLGFGDIAPGTRWIMTFTIFEAITGSMYLTVVVARLVALFSNSDS